MGPMSSKQRSSPLESHPAALGHPVQQAPATPEWDDSNPKYGNCCVLLCFGLLGLFYLLDKICLLVLFLFTEDVPKCQLHDEVHPKMRSPNKGFSLGMSKGETNKSEKARPEATKPPRPPHAPKRG